MSINTAGKSVFPLFIIPRAPLSMPHKWKLDSVMSCQDCVLTASGDMSATNGTETKVATADACGPHTDDGSVQSVRSNTHSRYIPEIERVSARG
jgi:hypothetical protein